MEQHRLLSDEEFEQQFAQGTLVPSLFSHEAHLRLAYIHLEKYGEEKAIHHILQQLQQFVIMAGARDKFHKTLTIAAIKAVHHFKRRSNSSHFRDFIEEFPRLKSDFKALINSHYQIDVFRSESAKKVYLEPDVLPFD